MPDRSTRIDELDKEAEMNTAWQTYHRRAGALRQVIADLDRSGSSTPPWDDELAALFDGPDDLLVALHDLWSRRLAARVDLALEIDEHGPEESVALAWREVADELSGVRRVLDQHGDNPALQRSGRQEHRMLAVSAGLATIGDPASRSAAVGARLVARIRGADRSAGGGSRLTERVAGLVRRVPMPIVGARLGA
ncbi:MAG TPA: hypothetical protein VFY58_05560 [Nocardioides sp.]|nr:hypothetical protein [Nocardioides sp.]